LILTYTYTENGLQPIPHTDLLMRTVAPGHTHDNENLQDTDCWRTCQNLRKLDRELTKDMTSSDIECYETLLSVSSVTMGGGFGSASNYSKWRLVSSYLLFTNKPASTTQTRGSGVFLLLIPQTWPSLILLNQGLAILHNRGNFLYTDRTYPVVQADGPGSKIKEPIGTKEGRKRDEIEIRGYDFFLSLTISVLTGVGQNLPPTTH